MNKRLYVMLLEEAGSPDQTSEDVVVRHVENIRSLDDNRKLALCGPVEGLPGVVGMIILNAESYEEAEAICKTEPFVAGGYATYKLAALQVADSENNYLL